MRRTKVRGLSVYNSEADNEKGADYVVSLKGNQGTLHDAVKKYWDMLDFNKSSAQAASIKFRTTSRYEEKHRRKESRDYGTVALGDRKPAA